MRDLVSMCKKKQCSQKNIQRYSNILFAWTRHISLLFQSVIVVVVCKWLFSHFASCQRTRGVSFLLHRFTSVSLISMEDSASDDSSGPNPWEGLDGIATKRIQPPAALRCTKHGHLSCEDCARFGRFPYDDSDNESLRAEPGAMALKDMVFSPSILNHNPIDEEMVSGSEPTPEQDPWTVELRSTAISAAISNQVSEQVAEAVRGQVRDQRSKAISAAISTQVADAVHTQVRNQQAHEGQLRSEAISAAVEEERRAAEGERVHAATSDDPRI